MAEVSTAPLSERRLAAVLAADIAGYSRLMGQDEAVTVRALKAHQAVVLPMVSHFGGTIIDTAGDGILAQFPSAVRAVECAVEIQKIMGERNFDVPEERRMLFRIGVNLGDLIHDGQRVYGDGVNVAARLESIAKPGGICIAASVRDAIFGKLGLPMRDLGERNFKNITRPVRTYEIQPDGAPTPRIRAVLRLGRSKLAMLSLAVMAIGAAGAFSFWLATRSEKSELNAAANPGARPPTSTTLHSPAAAAVLRTITNGTDSGRLQLSFEDAHEPINSDYSVTITHEWVLTFSSSGQIKELRRESNSGMFAHTATDQFVLDATIGRVTWKALRPDTLQRTLDSYQHTLTLTITIGPDRTCALDVNFSLKPGFQDIILPRLDIGGLAHFTLPRPMNASCNLY